MKFSSPCLHTGSLRKIFEQVSLRAQDEGDSAIDQKEVEVVVRYLRLRCGC